MSGKEEKRAASAERGGEARGTSGASRNETGHRRQDLPDEDGWATARNKEKQKTKGKSEDNGVTTTGQGRSSPITTQQDKKPALATLQAQSRGQFGPRGNSGGKKAGADQSDAVFNQLWSYLKGGASPEYVAYLADRLGLMARERRFRAYVKHLPEEAREDKEEDQLGNEWTDEAPAWRQEKYERLKCTWDMDLPENVQRLTKLLYEWMVTEKLQQREIEDRLQFLTFTHSTKEKQATPTSQVPTGSYKDAVSSGAGRDQHQDLTDEQQRLRRLCLKDFPPLTELRERTEDETKAIVMLLNYEFEVPQVPAFLQQSMKAGELACFTDIFMALEYPLYAHLAPGHRFLEDMSKTALMNQIYAGEEAAPAQKREIELFKENLARISLNMETRLLTVTFKGKTTAAHWVGWQVPLASRLITLVDYESKRDTVQTTHELVLIDYYSFTVEARKGIVTSKDIFWVTDTMLGLDVQGITHPVTPTGGVNEHQCVGRVKAEGCPSPLKNVYYIVVDAVELVVHHHSVNVNWPCRMCREANHSTKWCKVPAAEVEKTQTEVSRTLKGNLPSKQAQASRGYRTGGQSKTWDQLHVLLTQHNSIISVKDVAAATQREKKAKRALSPKRTSGRVAVNKPSLPDGWQQSLSSSVIKEPANEDRGEGNAEAKEEYNAANEDPEVEAKATEDCTIPPSTSNFEFEAHDPDEDVEMQEDNCNEETNDNKEGGDNKQPASANKESIPPHAAETENGTHRTPEPLRQTNSRDPPPLPRVKRQSRSRRASTTREKQGTHKSLSPKRKASDSWSYDRLGGEDECGRNGETGAEKRSGTRSLSPKRRSTAAGTKKDKPTMQQYIHQFMTAVADHPPSPPRKEVNVDVDAMAKEAAVLIQQDINQMLDEERRLLELIGDTADPERQATLDNEGYEITKTTTPTDKGAHISEWTTALQGLITDVEALGHCGWLAYYARLYNIQESLEKPSKAVAQATELRSVSPAPRLVRYVRP